MESKKRYERDPFSAPGDFYRENQCCTSCGIPEVVAPDLIGRVEERYTECFWKKQPETKAELERAFAIFEGQELGCFRYAGHDPAIQARIGSEFCDYWDGRRASVQVDYDGPIFWTEPGFFERI